jgi:hypothetical protein
MKTASKKAPRGKLKLVAMKDRRGNLHPFTPLREGVPMTEEQASAPAGTFVPASQGDFRFQKLSELGHKGPAKVSSPKFRDEWTRIFGEKKHAGPAN